MARTRRASSSSSASAASSGKGLVLGVPVEVVVAGLALTVLYQYLSTHRPQVQAALGGGSRMRRYTEFEPFYAQLYRHEHASAANRHLHFIGTSLAVLQLLRDPRLLLAGLVAVVVGLNLFELLYWMPHGLPEFALMGCTFLVVGKRLTGSFRRPGGVLFIGYLFAWLGHFAVEGNKPATFTYAVYSLLGDFRMWWDTARELTHRVRLLV